MARKDDEKPKFDSEYALNMLSYTMSSYFGEVETSTGTIIRKGRAPKYETVEELHLAIEGYFNKLEEWARKGTPHYPDVEDFCAYARISRETFKLWQEPGVKTGEFREEVKRFDTALAAYKKQLMFKGAIPAVPALADLNNNHGYTNQTTTVKHQFIHELPTIEEIARKLPGE